MGFRTPALMENQPNANCANLWYRFWVMGQIVIDIPSNKKRRYVLTNSEKAETLLSELERSAVRLKTSSTKLTRQQLQDLRDGQEADEALEEMRRTGKRYSVEQIRRELGL